MIELPSKTHTLLARIAVDLLIGLAVLGVVWYGLSTEELDRASRNVVARPGGPMTFGFVIQPRWPASPCSTAASRTLGPGA